MGAWIYVEQQRFRQWWLWLIVLTAALGGSAGILTLGRNDLVTIFGFILVLIGVPLFFVILKLRTKVGPETVELEFVPLWTRTIPVSTIVSVEDVTYRPLLHYGGWGIRYSFGHGWAYNVSGNKGVHLHLTEGKPVVIGSRRSEELCAAINSVLPQG